MQERFGAGWTDPRVLLYGEAPKYKHQVRYSFGLNGTTKKGYMVVKYEVARNWKEEVLVDGLTLEEADGFLKLLEED